MNMVLYMSHGIGVTIIRFYMKVLKKIFYVGSFISLVSCSTYDDTEKEVAKPFTNSTYPELMQPIRQSVVDADVSGALDSYKKNISDNSEIATLDDLEIARLEQLSDNFNSSIETYNKAIDTIPKTNDQIEDDAKEVILNKDTYDYYENKVKYSIPDYSITFLYTYQSLNYLKNHDLKKALETLKGLDYAKNWLDEQDMIAAGMKELGKDYFNRYQISTQTLGLKYFDDLNSMVTFTKRVPDAYGNPLSYYLKAMLIEATSKDYESALDEINNARKYTLGNKSLERTAMEYKRAVYHQLSPFPMGMGRIVVLYEQSFINARQKTKTKLDLGDLGLINFSFPFYSSNYDFLSPVKVVISDEKDNKLLETQTEILMDTTLYAMKSLVEEYSRILTKDVLIEIAKQSYDKNAKGLGGLLGNHLKFDLSKTEPKRADLRSWLLLPNSIQLFEQVADSGKYIIIVNNVRQKIRIEQGKTTLVWVVDIGKFKKVFYFII
ncbi:hypothetical protein KX01_1532 [Francisella frigiditurris]|uniref:Uncharacterized protein n=2 Tax=Francisella frigiditurris TaxID=1542390 RepID=A0A1J0KTB9_9GAMM|nr:hypothetical protein KX01_1532 [Francisella frigiditurris]